MATKQEITKKTFEDCLNKVLQQTKPIIYLEQVIEACKSSIASSFYNGSWQAIAKTEGIRQFMITMTVIAKHRTVCNIKDFKLSLPRIREIVQYVQDAEQFHGVTASQYKVLRTNNYMTAYHAKHNKATDAVIGHPKEFYPLTDQLQVSKNGTYHIKTVAYEKMIRTNW